ncbi:hypothetical protein HLI01_18940 [Rhizobium laguerreae]|uniref:hypothetical protein n=1 Tax=Rhizobium laguerreae TaxID=1076926 RepID=UPI001478D8FA|nr:hypothetical protein [Rhizobium laguerreae]NNH58834.1 hypothetical protein [Rhizobium laguerreae]
MKRRQMPALRRFPASIEFRTIQFVSAFSWHSNAKRRVVTRGIFVMVDRHSDLPSSFFSIFLRHLKRPTKALISNANGVGRPAAQTAASMVRQSCVFRFSGIEQLLHCRNQVPAFSSFPAAQTSSLGGGECLPT